MQRETPPRSSRAIARLRRNSSTRRLAELESGARFAEELAWELERASPETLEDVADSVERLERRKAVAHRERARRQKPLDVRVADDARIYVGRSPRGNADLTFRIARPGDLWFHARATPGAHVVLQLDSQRHATATELERAASLAAYHSKARGSEKVSVDYTERKHVRRQQNAPPGLVWYTNARTVLVAPSASEA
jgi:predicted ribosome quality control (RQC) complex YloA/Tae2 family protein